MLIKEKGFQYSLRGFVYSVAFDKSLRYRSYSIVLQVIIAIIFAYFAHHALKWPRPIILVIYWVPRPAFGFKCFHSSKQKNDNSTRKPIASDSFFFRKTPVEAIILTTTNFITYNAMILSILPFECPTPFIFTTNAKHRLLSIQSLLTCVFPCILCICCMYYIKIIERHLFLEK